MREDQLIALKRSSVDELDPISIMGAAGNHRSLAVYLGILGGTASIFNWTALSLP